MYKAYKPSAYIVKDEDSLLFYDYVDAINYAKQREKLKKMLDSGELRVPLSIVEVFTRDDIERMNARVTMTPGEFKEWQMLYSVEDYWSHAEDDLKLSSYSRLNRRVFEGDVAQRVENTNMFAILWAKYNPERPMDTIKVIAEPFTVNDGDLVIGRDEHSANIHIIEGNPDIDENGKQLAVLLVDGKEDRFYANVSNDLPQGGDYGTMDDFYNDYRLLARREDLLKGDE